MKLRRGVVLSVSAALVAVILSSGMASAMLQEGPQRRNIINAVAVLRHLYEEQLNYENRIDMVRRSIDGTQSQFDALHGLMKTELEQPAPDVIKLRRYSDSLNDLIEGLQQYGPNAYLESMHRYEETLTNTANALDSAVQRLELATENGGVITSEALAEIRGGVDRLYNALRREDLREIDNQLITLGEMMRNFERELEGVAGGSEEHRRQVEQLESNLVARQGEVLNSLSGILDEVSATPAVRDDASLLRAAEELKRQVASARETSGRRAVDEQRIEDYRRLADNFREDIQALEGRIDRFSADDHIDYERMYAERLDDIRQEILYHERVLDARMTEYRALFGEEPSVITDYRAEVERFYPESRMGGVLMPD